MHAIQHFTGTFGASNRVKWKPAWPHQCHTTRFNDCLHRRHRPSWLQDLKWRPRPTQSQRAWSHRVTKFTWSLFFQLLAAKHKPLATQPPFSYHSISSVSVKELSLFLSPHYFPQLTDYKLPRFTFAIRKRNRKARISQPKFSFCSDGLDKPNWIICDYHEEPNEKHLIH